jgi:hypothetical protein
MSDVLVGTKLLMMAMRDADLFFFNNNYSSIAISVREGSHVT